MTQDNATRLSQLVAKMREIAVPIGSMHAWWQDITESEDALERKMDDATAEKMTAEAERLLASVNDKSPNPTGAAPLAT